MLSCRRFLCFTLLILLYSSNGRSSVCEKHCFCGKGPCGKRVVAKHVLEKFVEIIGVFLGRLHISGLHSLESAKAESNNQVVDATSETLFIIESANRIQVGTLAYAHDLFVQAHVHIL